MQRVAIFIDGAYLDYVQKTELDGIHMDLEKLPKELADIADILRTYYYHCLPYQGTPPSKEEAKRFGKAQKFFNITSTFKRFQLRLGTLVLRGYDEKKEPIYVQKKVDILLGVDLAILSGKRQINEAVLLAGDSDFIPAVEAAKAEGVLIRLFHGKSVHRELWNAVDERVLIDRVFAEKVKLIHK